MAINSVLLLLVMAALPLVLTIYNNYDHYNYPTRLTNNNNSNNDIVASNSRSINFVSCHMAQHKSVVCVTSPYHRHHQPVSLQLLLPLLLVPLPLVVSRQPAVSAVPTGDTRKQIKFKSWDAPRVADFDTTSLVLGPCR